MTATADAEPAMTPTAEAVPGDETSEAAATSDSEQAIETRSAAQDPVGALQAQPVAAAQPPPTAGTPEAQESDGAEPGLAEAAPRVAGTTGVAAGANASGSRKAETGFEAVLADASVGATAEAVPATVAGVETGTIAPPAAATETKPAQAVQIPAATTAPPPVPLGAVPMTIGLRAMGGASRFEIRLDPVELGRIDVSLDIDRERGTVGARVVVDRPETLALLQRDASSLQQALAQTGLDASAGFSLSLRDSGGEGRRDGGSDGQPARSNSRNGGTDSGTGSLAGSIETATLRPLRGYGGLDIRI